MMVQNLFQTDNEQFGAFEENANRYRGMSNQYKAQLHFKLGNKPQMERNLKRANRFYGSLPIERTRLLEISASMHHDLGDYNKALAELNVGIEIAASQGLSERKKYCIQPRSGFYQAWVMKKGIIEVNEQLLLMNQKKVMAQNRDLLTNMELREQLRSRQAALDKIQQERRQFIVLGLVAGVIAVLVILRFAPNLLPLSSKNSWPSKASSSQSWS